MTMRSEGGKLNAYRNAASQATPKTMRAVTVSGRGFENLAVRDVPVPTPGPNQLLARVDAAGVCTSILKLLAQGEDHTFINGWPLTEHPVILGDEGAVTIVEVGEALTGEYEPGQRFAVQPAVDIAPINHRQRYRNNAAGMSKVAVGYTLPGHLAEYMLIPEEVLEARCLLPLPADLPYFAVSMAEPISCVVSAQDRQIHLYKAGPFEPRVPRLGMLEGGVTVVIGAGAMGRMHMELAMRFRPRAVIASDLLDERLDIVRQRLGSKAASLGVELHTIKPEQLKPTIDQLTGGRGADDIVMAVGVQKVQQAALDLLGPGGVANLFGGLPRGQHTLEVDAIKVHYDEIKLVGSSGGQPSDMAATLDAIATGDIDPGNYVYGVGGLEHAPKVLEMIRDGLVDGKTILYPHARIDSLRSVDHWSGEDENTLLEGALR